MIKIATLIFGIYPSDTEPSTGRQDTLKRESVLKRTSEFIGEACGALCPSFDQLLFAEQSLRSWERITCCKSDLSQTDLLKRFPKATLKRTRHVCIWHLVEWLYWVHLKESDKFSHVMLMPIGAENVWPKYQNEGKRSTILVRLHKTVETIT